MAGRAVSGSPLDRERERGESGLAGALPAPTKVHSGEPGQCWRARALGIEARKQRQGKHGVYAAETPVLQHGVSLQHNQLLYRRCARVSRHLAGLGIPDREPPAGTRGLQ